MKITLIKGVFESDELFDIITQMIHVKIKFHENLIKNDNSEEHIKMREKRIVSLQRDLFELRKVMKKSNKLILAEAEINLEFVRNELLA